jgi:hypothetical protein
MRTILSEATVLNDLYQPPQAEEEIRSEMERVLGLGMAGVVSGGALKVVSIFEKVKDENPYDLEDLNDLRNTPVFIGIYNHIEQLFEVAQQWDQELIPVQVAAENLVQLDIKAIFNKERNKIQTLVKVGEISMMGLRALAAEQFVMYGSSTSESTYTASRTLHKSVSSTLAVATKDLKSIVDGTYAPKASVAETLSAWANFTID